MNSYVQSVLESSDQIRKSGAFKPGAADACRYRNFDSRDSDYLPKSSTRRKSRFLFVIETARVLTLLGETGWPAKAGRRRRGKISRRFVGEEVIGREGGLIPKNGKRKDLLRLTSRAS